MFSDYGFVFCNVKFIATSYVRLHVHVGIVIDFKLLTIIFINLSWFSCRYFGLVDSELGSDEFLGGRKTTVPREKPSEQSKKQQ